MLLHVPLCYGGHFNENCLFCFITVNKYIFLKLVVVFVIVISSYSDKNAGV